MPDALGPTLLTAALAPPPLPGRVFQTPPEQDTESPAGPPPTFRVSPLQRLRQELGTPPEPDKNRAGTGASLSQDAVPPSADAPRRGVTIPAARTALDLRL